MLHVQQSPLLRIARAGLATFAAALSLVQSAATAGAETPAAPCYELIPARAGIEPPAPMLVDKCNGRTWLLVRAGRGVYRWATLRMDADMPKATDRPATDSQPARKDDGGQKCFTFNNRKFCE
jgi:hypothetical protein